MTFECISVRFSDIKNMDVIDSNGEKLGRANDFLFEWNDGKIALQSVVMGGNRLEEFLESIGIRSENDPVFHVGCIEKIEDAVYLKSECAGLGDSYDPDGGKPEYLKLSKLSKIKVIDSDGFKVGNVIDVWFDSCSEVHLLLGGGFLEETLEKLRLKPDIDLLVPEEFIENVSDKEVCLKYTKFQLESTAEDEYDKQKAQIVSRDKPGDSAQPPFRLAGRPSRGFS